MKAIEISCIVIKTFLSLFFYASSVFIAVLGIFIVPSIIINLGSNYEGTLGLFCLLATAIGAILWFVVASLFKLGSIFYRL